MKFITKNTIPLFILCLYLISSITASAMKSRVISGNVESREEPKKLTENSVLKKIEREMDPKHAKKGGETANKQRKNS